MDARNTGVMSSLGSSSQYQSGNNTNGASGATGAGTGVSTTQLGNLLGQLAAASPRDAAQILGGLFGDSLQRRVGQAAQPSNAAPTAGNANYWLALANAAQNGGAGRRML